MIEVVKIHEHKHPKWRLGRHVEHDHRSRAFEVQAASGPLKSVTFQRYCEVYDQGDLGSCTGNAMAGLLMTGPFYVPGRDLTESDAVSIYEAATLVDNIDGSYPPDDTGSSSIGVCKAAQDRGMISAYYHAFSFAGAIAALSKAPVLIGIHWYEGFDTPIGDRAELQISGTVRGGHELYLNMLDVENGYVGGWNSWGPGFGNGGQFVMSFPTFRQILRERGDCTAPQLVSP